MGSFLLALLWLTAGANTLPVNPEPLSRDHLMAQKRMDAFGRVIQPKLGTQQTFWVRVPNDTFGLAYQYAQRTATLRRTGRYCHLFVSDSLNLPDSYLDSLQAMYDTIIYPTCRRYFGHEWIPGIDGDSLVNILMYPKLYRGYYFSPYDEISDSLARGQKQHSNEREMFYLRVFSNWNALGAATAYCQERLIHWYQNPPAEEWVSDACAMHAAELCGFQGMYDGEVEYFSYKPTQNPLSKGSSGMRYAFLAYLMEKYPGRDPQDSMIRHLVARRDLGDSTVFKPYGFMNVAVALWETGGPPSYVEPFLCWTVANFVNDTTLVDSISSGAQKLFGYQKPMGGIARFQVRPTVGPPDLFDAFPDSAFLGLSWYGQSYVFIPKGSYDLTVELVQDTAVYFIEGIRFTQFVYRGYVVTTTTSDFAPGTNTIHSIQYPTTTGTETLHLGPDIKGIRIIPSLPQYYQGALGSPRFYVFAYTPFNPRDTTVNRSAYVFPNPFNPNKEKVHFHYVLAQKSKVDIRVYDAAGNQLTVVAEDRELGPGIYNSQTWDGRNYRGTPVANGVYFGRVKVGNKTTGVKIAVMR